MTDIGLRKQIFEILGSGYVVHHEPTPDNPLGQSGAHTFADDLINIVLNSKNETDAYNNIRAYLGVDTILGKGTTWAS